MWIEKKKGAYCNLNVTYFKLRLELSTSICSYPVKWSELNARKRNPIQLWCLSKWLNKINEGWYLAHTHQPYHRHGEMIRLYWTNQYWKAIIKWAFIPKSSRWIEHPLLKKASQVPKHGNTTEWWKFYTSFA